MIKEGLSDIWHAIRFLGQIWPRPEDVKDLPMNQDDEPVVQPEPVPTPPKLPLPAPQPEKLLWDTPKHNWHSVRVMCDEAGLTFTQKNILCACVWQESEFRNYINGKPVRGDNVRNGKITSSDWGLIQVNDTKGWHIGPGLRFSSVQDVLDHPERAVAWMIKTMKDTGKLQPWASYTSGAYKKWIPLTSPMWKLAKK